MTEHRSQALARSTIQGTKARRWAAGTLQSLPPTNEHAPLQAPSESDVGRERCRDGDILILAFALGDWVSGT
ncbi:hypothetical protein [Vibrio mediterranei]|uniref:hypothetical protein n=1 Tax=Vibrio mediterranei TaxID=689 RepID=UPI00148C3A17|nr:hypothetical protein [Vibrio mediterranei]NOI26952.1 hypothetical protein [Vibrio mediterranei]